jgi:hypothetical protein
MKGLEKSPIGKKMNIILHLLHTKAFNHKIRNDNR